MNPRTKKDFTQETREFCDNTIAEEKPLMQKVCHKEKGKEVSSSDRQGTREPEDKERFHPGDERIFDNTVGEEKPPMQKVCQKGRGNFSHRFNTSAKIQKGLI